MGPTVDEDPPEESDDWVDDEGEEPGNFPEQDVIAAMEKHLRDVIDKNESYDVILPEQVTKTTQKMDCRWVLAVRDGVLKARLCARDFAVVKRDDLFAPGSVALTARVVDLKAVKEQWPTFELDVTAAYNTLPEPEDVAVTPPRYWLDKHVASGGDPRALWRMKRLLPGRRIAAKCWVDHVGVVLRSLEFMQDAAMPQFFFHTVRKIGCEVHMDDIHGVSKPTSLPDFIDEISDLLPLKKAGVFDRPGQVYSHLQKERHLYRSGRLIVPSGKYVKRVADELGLTNAKPAPTPETEGNRRRVEDKEHLLSTVDATGFRSMACCLLYVAHDMGEIQHGVRELTCDLREPTTASIARLKRVTRYLLGTVDEGIWFGFGGDFSKLRVSTDTDWAGCKITRKSCACIVARCGGCTLFVGTSGQAIHAQSSGESEFYGTTSGASAALLLRHVLQFFEIETAVELLSDSSAARAVLNRSGVGRIRHLEVKTLWVQEAVKAGKLAVKVVKGVDNVADIGTKVLARKRILYLKQLLGVRKLPKDGEYEPQELVVEDDEEVDKIVRCVVETIVKRGYVR